MYLYMNLYLSTRRERTTDFHSHKREILNFPKQLDILPGSTTTVAVKAAVVLNGHERDGQRDGHLGACYRDATRASVLSLLPASRSGKKKAGCCATLRC